MRLQCSRFHVFCMLSFAMIQFSELLANTCDSEDVYNGIDDCVDQNISVNPALFDDGTTASLIHARISAECGARHNVKTCVENKYDYCRNKTSILEVLEQRYRICEEGLPYPWITQWMKDNPSAKFTYACIDVLDTATTERIKYMFRCTSLDSNIYTSNFSLNSYSAYNEMYYSSQYTCTSELYRDIAVVINNEQACVDVRDWNNVLTFINLTMPIDWPKIVTFLPDETAAVKKNAAS